VEYQKEVKIQIVKGMSILTSIIAVSWLVLPGFNESQRLAILSGSILLLATPLFLSITIVLLGRYSNESLILGYISNSDGLKFKQAYLQNTLEQTTANLLVLIALGLVVPAFYLKICIIQAICFLAGRALFFTGYNRNPMERFTGFVVGWYAVALAYITAAYFVVIKFI
jgi:hypothetical protein